MAVLDRLAVPVVLASMAGGPSPPALAAAVTAAGGLGFLAAGYLAPERLAADVAAARRLTVGPLGVNVFSAPGPADPAEVAAYAAHLAPLAARHGVALGAPAHDDDGLAAKVGLLRELPVEVVSFTFGPPPASVVDALHAGGAEVWSTVTDRDEAEEAAARGVDTVVAQGAEAAGGIVDAADLAAARTAGAVQVGTAFLLCPEAGTSPVHRAAIERGGPTVLTRAFSGRRARGLANAWTEEVGADAPVAYPDVHHLTMPLRPLPAAEVVAALHPG